MLIKVFFVFFLLLPSVSAEEIAADARQLLEKMSLAMKELSFQGTVAFFKDGRLDTMRYIHANDKGREQERLLSLNSPMREVIREAGKVSCVFKDTDKIVVNHHPVSASFLVDLPDDFSELSNVYEFSFSEDESVAMRPAFVVKIQAKDEFRYGRKIWVDKQHFLPLKVEIYDFSGKTLEQVVFTDLRIDNQSSLVNVNELLAKGSISHIHELDLSPYGQADFEIVNLPPQFDVVFFMPMRSEENKKKIDHLMLSDGFSSISLYRELKTDDMQVGFESLGAVNSFTHLIGDVQITVMGEVPKKTVQSIAEGIKFKSQ